MKQIDVPRGLWMILPLAIGACVAPATDDDAPGTNQSEALSVCPGVSTVTGVDILLAGPHRLARRQAVRPVVRHLPRQRRPGLPRHAVPHRLARHQGRRPGARRLPVFRPEQDPIAQANLLLQALTQYGPLGAGDLPPVLDIEVVDGVSTAVFQQNVQAWLTHVQQATGKKPMIGTAPFMASTLGTGFSGYPLWVANYEVTCPGLPAGWSQWVIWQNGSGTVPGISGSPDVDILDGTLAQLLAFAQGSGVSGGGSNGIDWTCSSSAYQGAQYWTCNDGNLFECQSGVPAETACALGCVSEPVGRDDLCIASAPAWSCNASAYEGNQYWTCSGGSLYRCAGTAPETVACPNGCTGEPLGDDDICN